LGSLEEAEVYFQVRFVPNIFVIFYIDLWLVSLGSTGESRPAAEKRRADEMILLLDYDAMEDFVLASDRLRGS